MTPINKRQVLKRKEKEGFATQVVVGVLVGVGMIALIGMTFLYWLFFNSPDRGSRRVEGVEG